MIVTGAILFPGILLSRPENAPKSTDGKESIVTLSVLLIDDDPAMVGQLESAFTQEGCHVDCNPPGVDAIRAIVIHEPDLVILGVSSEDKDWQFCRRLFTFLDRPLLLLLSSANRLDRVRGLELGADDCMIKPVLIVEVLARARALLRRSEAQISRARHADPATPSAKTWADLVSGRKVWYNRLTSNALREEQQVESSHAYRRLSWKRDPLARQGRCSPF
jgi:DNA-binding response OmpR family regulator